MITKGWLMHFRALTAVSLLRTETNKLTVTVYTLHQILDTLNSQAFHWISDSGINKYQTLSPWNSWIEYQIPPDLKPCHLLAWSQHSNFPPILLIETINFSCSARPDLQDTLLLYPEATWFIYGCGFLIHVWVSGYATVSLSKVTESWPLPAINNPAQKTAHNPQGSSIRYRLQHLFIINISWFSLCFLVTSANVAIGRKDLSLMPTTPPLDFQNPGTTRGYLVPISNCYNSLSSRPKRLIWHLHGQQSGGLNGLISGLKSTSGHIHSQHLLH